MNLRRELTVDVNGRVTHVHRKIDSDDVTGAASESRRQLPLPSASNAAGHPADKGAAEVRLSNTDATVTVTPGMIDDNAIAAFEQGQCLALARAIAEDRGWEVALLFIDHPLTGKREFHHAYAFDGEDMYDINGMDFDYSEVSRKKLKKMGFEFYSPFDNELEARVEGSLPPQENELARSFVAPVLESDW